MPSSPPAEPVLVSFVIPALDEEELIGGALASAAGQTWPRVEIVVVDNGSQDGTAARAREFAEAIRPAAFRLVAEPDRGRSQAKNAGLRAAAGEVVVFLDADSRASADLAREVMRHREAGFPAGSIRVVADSDDRIDRAYFELMEVGKRWLGVRAQLFYTEAALLLAAGGFDEAMSLGEDRDALRRMAGLGAPICHLRTAYIATSPRRLRRGRLRYGMLAMFTRWALAHAGIGREWPY